MHPVLPGSTLPGAQEGPLSLLGLQRSPGTWSLTLSLASGLVAHHSGTQALRAPSLGLGGVRVRDDAGGGGGEIELGASSGPHWGACWLQGTAAEPASWEPSWVAGSTWPPGLACLDLEALPHCGSAWPLPSALSSGNRI